MIIDTVADENSFMKALGEALGNFFRENEITESEASKRMNMGRAKLNTYTHGLASGKRRTAPAELLAKACVLGFRFEFDGHTIVALKDGQPVPLTEHQLRLEFTRQFDLGDNGGTVAIGLKKPPGKIELSVSLRAVSE